MVISTCLKNCTALFLLAGGYCTAQAQTSYSISGYLDDAEAEGRKIYLQVYDTNTRIDSATITNQQFRMAGTAQAPYFARIDLDNWKEFALLVLEDSVEIDFKKHLPKSGGRLTKALLAYSAEKDSITKALYTTYEALKTEYTPGEELEAKVSSIFSQFKQAMYDCYSRWIQSNGDDGVGEAAWRDGKTDAALDNNPEMLKRLYNQLTPHAQSTLQSAQKGLSEINALENTAIGKPFVDVEGFTPEGEPIRLSDYAGKGKLTLVDFWASWCGPCRQEGRETLKPLWEKYKGNDNVTIIGVAVRDEKANTLQALAEEGYEWPQIIDTGNKPLEQYGIKGIPHILLLAPDGTIVARGLRGGGIEQAITEQLEKTNNQ